MIKGKAVSGGIAVGPAAVWRQRAPLADQRKLAEAEVEQEVARVEAAVAAARSELTAMREETAHRLGEQAAAIVDAHLMMLDDPALVGEAVERVRRERLAAPGLLAQVGEEVAQVLDGLEDPYLRERAADVRDVTGRLLRHLTHSGGLESVAAGSVLVADDLPPSELLRLPAGHLAGIVLSGGGTTSHTAILTRSMGIPAIMGAGEAIHQIPAGATLAMDADAGTVLINPDADLLAEYRERMAAQARERAELAQLRQLPAETQDGTRVLLAANIGSAPEAEAAREAGAEGVGLFRTEFLFLERQEPPSEEEQYKVYKAALEAMAPHPVLIRTLDIGGDKPLPFLGVPAEENPFLGWRGVRLCQGFPELFRTQLRAILRAAAHGRAQMMVPMVATHSEILWVREQLGLAREELEAASTPFGTELQVGIMVETPAAAVMADELAPLVDFFSIGTNDLTQYTMAVDRLNAKVAGLYDHLHPAVLRLVKLVVEGAHRHGRWVGMCGELAGVPLATPVLLGLGLDELSMSAPRLARVKKAVRSLDMAKARSLAEAALQLADGEAVRTFLAKQ